MNKFYTIVITVVLIACQHINSCVHATKNDDDEHERSKRFVFLQTSGIGYLVALAIPTSAINRQRVYMAFNFEAHYGLASGETYLSSLRMPFIGNDLTQKRDIHGAIVDDRLEHFAGKKNVYTRKNFYRILEQQIQSYGYNGTSCLLRTICETSETPFYEYNGVFGNIFHILFTPSSSQAEKIRSIYYEAEYHGRLQECHRYVSDCNISFLDLISKMISIKARNMV